MNVYSTCYSESPIFIVTYADRQVQNHRQKKENGIVSWKSGKNYMYTVNSMQ